MQVLGIYLYKGSNPKVIKNLKEGWYPFGDIPDCSKIFDENGNINETEYNKIKKQINENQDFTNKLYEIEPLEREDCSNKKLYINLNCILGKNGSGKSSLISLEYRIINNLACTIKQCCSLICSDHKLEWASGFNANLYYKLYDELYCISICNNDAFEFDLLQENGEGKVRLFGRGVNFNEIFQQLKNISRNYENKDNFIFNNKTLIEYYEQIKVPLNELSKHLFYTVGVNYSIYSNSVAYDIWNDKKENWLTNIYHKNDGYFTPIVLVPYKQNGSEINVDKELKLARERISTLSLLLFSENKSDFIENLIPSSIEFSLMDSKEFDFYIKKKYVHSFSVDLYSDEETEINKCYRKIRKDYNLSYIIPCIKKIWKDKIFNQEQEKIYKQNIKREYFRIYQIIKNNTLKYLVYKTIKICIYYDDYRKHFEDIGFVDFSRHSKVFFEAHIDTIISEFIREDIHLDFTNLKIIQCIKFLKNMAFYFNSSIEVEKFKPEAECDNTDIVFHKFIYSSDFCINFPDAKDYDSVFINLPSSIFRKEFFYKEKKFKDVKNRENERSQSMLSSGESQILNSLSYVIYHIKNAASNQNFAGRLQYKNFNLIFDEAELYYHPEYQQRFISDLLGIIRRSNLKDVVDSINITIITHSPFMLSDIPNANILCMPNDVEKKKEIDVTLGANIYDLLKNQFFMETSIGSLIETTIVKIIKDYNNYKNGTLDERNKIKEKYVANKSFYYKLLLNISDSYFKSLLSDVFAEFYNTENIDEEIKEQEKKLADLRTKKKALQEYEKNLL